MEVLEEFCQIKQYLQFAFKTCIWIIMSLGLWGLSIFSTINFLNCHQNKVVRWPLLPFYYNQWWVVLGTEKIIPISDRNKVHWSSEVRYCVSLAWKFIFCFTKRRSLAPRRKCYHMWCTFLDRLAQGSFCSMELA
jgi:hypothetical protein